MSAERITYAVLSGHAALTAIVGARIYPLALPESIKPPAVVYEVISSNEVRTLSMAHTSRLVRATMRVTGVVAPADYPDLVALMSAIREAAQGKVNVTLGGVPNVVVTVGVESSDAYDAEMQLASRSRVFNVTYNEDSLPS